jgi:hypothetical protein
VLLFSRALLAAVDGAQRLLLPPRYAHVSTPFDKGISTAYVPEQSLAIKPIKGL